MSNISVTTFVGSDKHQTILKAALPILFFIAVVIISSCEKPEEILPLTPVPDSASVHGDKINGEAEAAEEEAKSDTTTADTTASDTTITDKTVQGIDSALYRYGKFQDMPYRILLPKYYDPSKSYPLLLFLHGIGERGTDNEKQLTWGASLFQADSIRERYPAVIVFPQCKVSQYWFDDWAIERLKGLTDDLVANLGIDKNKIYIGGLSMGAYGTYAMVAAYPELFAGAIAISGDGDETKASIMAKTKWRIFAGRNDNVVSSRRSEKMAAALTNSGALVSFTLYPQADHVGSWVNAFAEPDFCSWMFSFSRGDEQRN